MSFCLPREQVDKFVKALTSGEIDPAGLAELSSADRRAALAKFVGEADAQEVNALFESKLLLKNQQAGMINWASKVIGINEAVRADMISKITKLDKVLDPADQKMFLSDLVEKKLGIQVTPEEAKTLADFARSIEEYKKPYIEAISQERAKIISNLKPGETQNEGKINRILVDIWNNPKSELAQKSLEYGAKLQEFKNYISELKTEANKKTIKDYAKNPLMAAGDFVQGTASLAKSLWSTLDNSFQLRQGFQLLTTGNYKAWAKGFVKSWETIGKQLIAKNEFGGYIPRNVKELLSQQSSAVMDAVKAKAFSHPLAVDGSFARAKLAIGLTSEEAFPPSFIEKIPLAGRLMSASEAAYNASAIRLRVDVGSKLIMDAMEQKGGKLTNAELADIGELTNSLTGRGSVALTATQASWANFLTMSVRFIKSQWNILTAHSLGRGLDTPFAKKTAAINTLKTYATLASVFLIAKAIDPESVDFKNHLGKIKVNGAWLSTPMSSMAQTAANIAFFLHDSITSPKTPKYGSKTGVDILTGFMEGKASPVGAVIRDYMEGQTFNHKKPTLGGELKSTFTPLPIQTFKQNQTMPDLHDQILFNVLEFIGQSSNIPSKKK